VTSPALEVRAGEEEGGRYNGSWLSFISAVPTNAAKHGFFIVTVSIHQCDKQCES
jgi:hypothetical protein